MIEARLLPQNGTTSQSSIASPGNGACRDKCGDVHVGILPAAVHHPESVGVPNLRTDGEDGPRMGLGISSWLRGLMSHRHSNSRIFQLESSNNSRGNLQLVPTVP